MAPPISPRAFRSAAAFRKWLARHHASATELQVRLFRRHAGHLGMTYTEALDEALCFGWIDGVRRSLDADTFVIRFTPRKRGSYWSLVNIRHAKRLMTARQMEPAGIAAFAARDTKRAPRYAFENEAVQFDAVAEAAWRKAPVAWRNFERRPPWYRRTATFRVMSAKREETRARRLAKLIEESRHNRPIPELARAKSPVRRVTSTRDTR